MGGSDAIRRFERMFPGIGYENAMFEKDLLSGGRTQAELNRKYREEDKSAEIAQNLENGGSILIGTYHYDFENGKETYIPAEKSDTTD